MFGTWFSIFILVTYASGYQLKNGNSIPDYLFECYQSDVLLHPMTLTTLIDIVRKIESSPFYAMDLRMETNAILQRYWRDGIRRDPNAALMPNIIPYTGDGMQVYKYALLRSMLPIYGSQLADDTLSLNERCTLHKMLSNTEEVWERGDERQLCPNAEPQRQITSSQLTGAVKSTCPVEKGVVKSDYGTLSPNRLLLAIATSLQPMEIRQNVILENIFRGEYELQLTQQNRGVDNFWASTAAGDIAEMLVFQLPKSNEPKFGPRGFWNDSKLPVNYHQILSYDGVLYDFWENTDAEILGAVDAIMLGSQMQNWVKVAGTLRLSQALEMFYSKRGERFPNQPRACKRKEFFQQSWFKRGNILSQQALSFAEILSMTSVNFIQNQTVFSNNLDKTMRSYEEHVMTLINRYPDCPQPWEYREMKIRLTVIFDATWDPYTTLQILNQLSENVGVSAYGSSITVINGVTGDVIVSQGRTVGELYQNWMLAKSASKEARSTDLTNGFLALKRLVETVSFRRKRSDPAADVTLVVGRTSFLTDAASQRITSTLKAIKSEVPDMRFFYVISTPDSRPWIKLTSLPFSQNDVIITADDNDLDRIFNKLTILEGVPLSLVPPICEDVSTDNKAIFDVEQILTPGIDRLYRIHPAYICASSYVNIQVENLHYGQVMFCLSRTTFNANTNPECTTLGKFDKHRFTVDKPCRSKVTSGPRETWDPNCQPIYIKATVLKSFSSCGENFCRYSDQVKFNFHVEGVNCLSGYAVTCSAAFIFPSSVLLFSLIIFVFQLK